MPLKKFGPNDTVLNTMKAYPSCEFFIFDSKAYYNNQPIQSGAFAANILGTSGSVAEISLYEYNIDRNDSIVGLSSGQDAANPFIYPWIYKSSTGQSFKTLSNKDWQILYDWGDKLTSKYPMSASITREYMTSPSASTRTIRVKYEGAFTDWDVKKYPHYFALKNRLDHYGARSEQYKVSSSYGNKDTQTLNVLYIPSIFYGKEIKPGTVSLKWFYTGSLIGELQDTTQNGELVTSAGSGSTDALVGGVVLYQEGIILLTGSWDLASDTLVMVPGEAATTPKWIYFGAGANDGVNTSTAAASYSNASFNLSFQGTSETQVLTMTAHAKRGQLNYSNNPTYLAYGQEQIQLTSSHVYEENPDRVIANFTTSSFIGQSASFKRQVYVSRIGVYDDNKNLIGVVSLADPILKQEDEDISFKFKIDI